MENQKNGQTLPPCPVETTLLLIGSKWKVLILRDLIDGNIRIAPSYPSLDELHEAMNLITLAVRLAALEKLMDN